MTRPLTTEDSEVSSLSRRGHRNCLQGFSKNFPLFFLCVLCGSGQVACGRKGPPLPPFPRLPAAATAVSARRVGQDVVFQFAIPTANMDGHGSLDLDRVDVYAHTGPLPSPLDFLKYGTLVGNVPVKPPAGPDAASRDQVPGFDPGAVASVSEAITPAQMVVGKAPVARTTTASAATQVAHDLETPGTVNAPVPLMRYYVAVATNRQNHRGAFTPPVGVPLVDAFATPSNLKVEYDETAVTLTWEPSTELNDVFAPLPAYNVYEVPDPAAPPSERPPVAGAPALNHAPLRAAINPRPVAAVPFKDQRMAFGVRRCYAVRSVRVAGPIMVESAASDPACVTLTDTFPPAAPKDLRSVANEGAISLIWEPNVEPDLAGYIVLRGEAPGEKLTPLTPMPIHETTYRDAAVTPGVAYVYAVAAVDNAPVPNISEYSDKANEVAR